MIKQQELEGILSLASNHIKRKRFRLPVQMFILCRTFPTSRGRLCGKGKNLLVWENRIQPTVMSKAYDVYITYRVGRAPQVWVWGEQIEKLEAPDFPHYYDKDSKKKKVRICLYRYQEFSSYKLLANTIVPWTAEWLYFYEIWLATGEWCGGGEHPKSGKKKE